MNLKINSPVIVTKTANINAKKMTDCNGYTQRKTHKTTAAKLKKVLLFKQ